MALAECTSVECASESSFRGTHPVRRSPIELACTVVSLVLAAAVFEGLNPLFEPHFAARPYSMSVTEVGLLLAVVCLVYTTTALPVGALVDKLVSQGAGAGTRLRRCEPQSSTLSACPTMLSASPSTLNASPWRADAQPSARKATPHCLAPVHLTLASVCCSALCLGGHSGLWRRVMCIGWIVTLGTSVLLWPAAGNPLHGHTKADWLAAGAPGGVTESTARLALILAVPALGISAALIIIPSLPDMQRGLEGDDELGRASMCALWNGAYSGGSAIGPIAAMIAYELEGWSLVVNAVAALAISAPLVLLLPGCRLHRTQAR